MAAQQSWAALHGTPAIQKRISIARPPAPPTEDSDVLVLNSRSTLPDPSVVGAKVLYLDLRLSLPTTKPVCINRAFAGLRETIPLGKAEESAVRYHWRHTVDSHGGGEPPDEGTMVNCSGEDGGNIEVESGVGLDPDTGKMGPYKEVWESERIPVSTPFVFLTSDADPDRSSGFMAILGPHAMGLWKSAVDEGISTTRCDGSGRFHAVRLRSETKHQSEDILRTYAKVFSTGCHSLDDRLEKLVKEMVVREGDGKQLWYQGERVILGDDQDTDSTWTVWDAGYVVD